MVTMTTVGYGDVYAQTAMGRLSTTVLIYFAGITLLAQIASNYIDFRIERRQKMLNGLYD